MKTLARLCRFLFGVLRELSDEGAYARHLARRGVAHSPAEWRRFCDHHLHARYDRGSCC